MNIKEISGIAGVSVATVSRVINNSPLVNPKTKDRILKITKKYKWHPNILARNLSTNKSSLLGVVVPPSTHLFSSSYFVEILKGIESELEKSNYGIFLCLPTRNKNLWENLIEEKKVDGIIYIAPDIKQTKEIEKKKVPIVLINSRSKYLPYVDLDNFGSAFKLAKYLISSGHKKIAIINGDLLSMNARDRFRGFSAALKKHKILLDKDFMGYGDYSQESGYSCTKKVLENSKVPQAIFCCNDLMAVGAIKAIKEKGKDVPGDISVVGFDNLDVSSYFDITTVSQPLFSMGKEAVKFLTERINGKKKIKNVIFKGDLIIRSSCRN